MNTHHHIKSIGFVLGLCLMISAHADAQGIRDLILEDINNTSKQTIDDIQDAISSGANQAIRDQLEKLEDKIISEDAKDIIKKTANTYSEIMDLDNTIADGLRSTSQSAVNQARNSVLSSKPVQQYNKTIDTINKYTGNRSPLNAIRSSTPVISDLTGDVKQLLAQSINAFDALEPLKLLMLIPSYTILTPVDNVQSAVNLASTIIHSGIAEAQLKSEEHTTAALGVAGSMHYQGDCVIDNYDYSVTIRSYMSSLNAAEQNTCQSLHLNTECWASVGNGSMFKTKGVSLDSYSKYFLKMDYVNASNQAVDKSIQQADIEKLYRLEQCCLSKKNNNETPASVCSAEDTIIVNEGFSAGEGLFFDVACDASIWDYKFNGRRITDNSANTAAFSELCDAHVSQLHNHFKKSNVVFVQLPIQHQQVLLDIMYQGGLSEIDNKAYVSALLEGECERAAASFGAEEICLQYPTRCTDRQSLMRAGCAGGQS